MRRLILVLAAVAALLVSALPALPQSGTCPGETTPSSSLGWRTLTVSTNSVGWADASGGIPAGTVKVIWQIETNPVRWREDGTAPTSTVGQFYAALSGTYVSCGDSVGLIRYIRDTTSTGSATATGHFFGR